MLQARGEDVDEALHHIHTCCYCPRAFSEHRRATEHVTREHPEELGTNGTLQTATLLHNRNKKGLRVVPPGDLDLDVDWMEQRHPKIFKRAPSKFRDDLKVMLMRGLARAGTVVDEKAGHRVTYNKSQIKKTPLENL